MEYRFKMSLRIRKHNLGNQENPSNITLKEGKGFFNACYYFLYLFTLLIPFTASGKFNSFLLFLKNFIQLFEYFNVIGCF